MVKFSLFIVFAWPCPYHLISLHIVFWSLLGKTHTTSSRHLSKHLLGPFDKQQNMTCAVKALSPGLSFLTENFIQKTLLGSWPVCEKMLQVLLFQVTSSCRCSSCFLLLIDIWHWWRTAEFKKLTNIFFIFYDQHPCCLLICFLVVSMAAPKVFCQDHSIAGLNKRISFIAAHINHQWGETCRQSRQLQLGFCCLHWEPVFTFDTKAWSLLMR